MTDDHPCEELKNAYAHLYDECYLETHPLAHHLAGNGVDEPADGQRLRRALLLAIEALDPGAEHPPHAPEARPYHVMRQYYIARHSMAQVAQSLAISERQAYRELRRAIATIARSLLATQLSATADEPGAPPAAPRSIEDAITKPGTIRAEVERLAEARSERLVLGDLIASAVHSVSSLATQRGITLAVAAEPDLAISTNRVVLRQALINLLSYLLSHHSGDQIPLYITQIGDEALLQVDLAPVDSEAMSRPEGPHAMAKSLFQALNLSMLEELSSTGLHITVRMPLASRHALLVIDDNAGAGHLIASYLRREPYTVHTITDPRAALAQIEILKPQVIILDIMMPDLDGWELLEHIRRSDNDEQPKIIVSSVIDDPALAAALGANATLHKPVSRTDLLDTLNQLLVD